MCVYIYICIDIYLSICLSIYLSLFLSVYTYVYIYKTIFCRNLVFNHVAEYLAREREPFTGLPRSQELAPP